MKFTVIGTFWGDAEIHHVEAEDGAGAVREAKRRMDEEARESDDESEDLPSEEFDLLYVFEGHLEPVDAGPKS